MFRDRMLGSMSDSSASGVFRIRPANTAQSCHSEVTGSGPVGVAVKAEAECLSAAPWPFSTRDHQWLRCLAHAVSPTRQPLLYYCRAGGETGHKGPCRNMGMWARNSLRVFLGAQWAGGWLGLPTTSSRTSFQRMRLPVSCTKVTLILLWMP